jgi:hypothetical protein
MQVLPGVLYAATRLAYLDICGNPLTMSRQERQWLLTNLGRNRHVRPNGLQVCCELAQSSKRSASSHIAQRLLHADRA